MIGTTAAILGASVIGAGASLLGSSQQASAANNAAALQNAQFQQTRADMEPWRLAGKSALDQQTNLLGLNGADKQTNAFSQFREDPGYQYTVNQAIQGVDRSAAARGLLTSGATIKAIQDRAANLADQGYGNYFNRLAGVAGTGQTTNTTLGQLGAQSAANQGNALIAAGNARASGYAGVASSINQGLNNWFAYKGPEARADGGPVEAGRPYWVGERGPELIVPSQNGTVVPNHAVDGIPADYLTQYRRVAEWDDGSIARDPIAYKHAAQRSYNTDVENERTKAAWLAAGYGPGGRRDDETWEEYVKRMQKAGKLRGADAMGADPAGMDGFSLNGGIGGVSGPLNAFSIPIYGGR